MAKVRGRTKIRERKKAKMEAKAENQVRENPSPHRPLTRGEKCVDSGCAAEIAATGTNVQIVIRHLATDSKRDLASLVTHADLRTSKMPKTSQQIVA